MQLGTMEHMVRSVKRSTQSHSFHTFGMERRNPNPRVKSEGKVWAAQFRSTEIINKSVIKQATTDIIALVINFTIFNRIEIMKEIQMWDRTQPHAL